MPDPLPSPSGVDPGSTQSSWLCRVQAGDIDARRRLADLYGPLLYAWCRRWGLQDADAADAVQDVFRAVLGNVACFQPRPGATFRGWLWTIARNRLRDEHRKRAHRPVAEGGSDALARLNALPQDDTEPTTRSDRAALLQRALAQAQPDFAPRTWEAFRLRMLEGRPVDAVAESLAMSQVGVRQASSRVLRRLRELLGETLP